MCAFYEDVVRLEAPRREEAFVVFEIRREIRWALDASERTFLEWKSQTLSSQLLAFNEMPIRPSEPRWRLRSTRRADSSTYSSASSALSPRNSSSAW